MKNIFFSLVESLLPGLDSDVIPKLFKTEFLFFGCGLNSCTDEPFDESELGDLTG